MGAVYLSWWCLHAGHCPYVQSCGDAIQSPIYVCFTWHLGGIWPCCRNDGFFANKFFFSLEEKISLLKTHLSKHLICLNMWPYTYFPQCRWVRIPRILSVCYTGFYRALPAAMESRTNTPHLKWRQRDAILISPLPYFRSCCCDKNTDKN